MPAKNFLKLILLLMLMLRNNHNVDDSLVQILMLKFDHNKNKILSRLSSKF